WSPDRRRIAFVRQDPGARSSSLYVIRRDGRGLLRLTRGEQAVALPAWSGDGRRIAFAASPLDGGSVEWTVAREGGPPRLVATGPAEQIAPSFSPSPTHTHWHLLGFQRYELRTLDGALIVRDRKSGFCLSDHYGLAARRVTAFAGKHFLGNCARSKPKALSVDQGTSIGFTDLYPAHFHGQNLELRGVPAGVYLLIHRADREQRLEEIDYANNAASIRIRLSWRDGKPRVATLRRCHASEVC
ncbi:MAG: lysyl oxidase family protein, partial [Gaiellaceae bacterium]